MASNLPKAGYDVIVHDVDDAKVQKAVSEWPNTIAANGKPEAFADCEVIVTMLPQGKIVREVLLGKENFARALKPGKTSGLGKPGISRLTKPQARLSSILRLPRHSIPLPWAKNLLSIS